MKGQCYDLFKKNKSDIFWIIAGFLIMVTSNKPVIRPGGPSDQLSTSEFSFSSVLGRVSRSSPPFQTKRHAQELATYNSCFLKGCFEYFFDFLQTCFFYDVLL